MSPQNGMTEKLFAQTLIGRVLADDIYIGSRCIAARNRSEERRVGKECRL